MPDMIDPAGHVTRVDDVIVSAAVKNFYVFVETEGEGDGLSQVTTKKLNQSKSRKIPTASCRSRRTAMT